APGAPGRVLLVPPLPPGVDHDRIAGLDLDPELAGHGRQLRPGDGMILGHVRNAAMPRDVEENAAGDDPGAERVDSAEPHAVRGHLAGGVAAVPHPVLVPNV